MWKYINDPDAVSKHLGRYVDEFTFLLNEGSIKIDAIERMGLLVANMAEKCITYRELTK